MSCLLDGWTSRLAGTVLSCRMVRNLLGVVCQGFDLMIQEDETGDRRVAQGRAMVRTGIGWALFFLLFLCAVTARGTDYYVDGLNGSDDATGGLTDPFLTVNRAVTAATGADVIHVRPATYHESVALVGPSRRGLSLVGVVEEGKYPVLVSADPSRHVIVARDFSGRIGNLEITGATDAIGINLIGDDDGVTTAQVIGCRVHGNRIGIHLTTLGSNRSCNPLIRNNRIYENTTRGIGFMNNATGTADGNDVHHNGSGLEDSSGIGISGHAAPTLVNNIIRANFNAGISIRDAAAPVIVHNAVTHHAVATGSVVGTGIRVQQNMGIDSLLVSSNIIAWNIHGLVSQGGRSCGGNRYNLFWQNSGTDYNGFTPGPGALAADPHLVDPQNGDFHLRAGSPCIDAGETPALDDHDMEGDSRPKGDGPDIGPDEFRPEDTSGGGSQGSGGSGHQPPPAMEQALQPVYMLLLR